MRKRLRGFQFLSAKPLLLVLNLDEADLPQADDAVALAGTRGVHVAAPRRAPSRSARRSSSRSRSSTPPMRAAFMADLGLQESGLDRVIRASYDLLGYISFFTVGEDECRAWSIPRDTPRSAGRRRDPLATSRAGSSARKWSRYEHLLARGTLAACRDHGELRLEGKEYIVLDGDVINFRHAT